MLLKQFLSVFLCFVVTTSHAMQKQLFGPQSRQSASKVTVEDDANDRDASSPRSYSSSYATNGTFSAIISPSLSSFYSQPAPATQTKPLQPTLTMLVATEVLASPASLPLTTPTQQISVPAAIEHSASSSSSITPATNPTQNHVQSKLNIPSDITTPAPPSSNSSSSSAQAISSTAEQNNAYQRIPSVQKSSGHANSMMEESSCDEYSYSSLSNGSSSSSSSQSVTPELDLKHQTDFRASILDTLPSPEARRRPITDALRKSVLNACPSEIHKIIAMWDKAKEQNVPLEQIEAHYKTIPKQWLLVGPPGTGKSTIGKAIAGACGIPFKMYSAPSISDQYQNSGTKNLEKIFKEAAALNESCVIIIDELEAFFKKHANKNNTDDILIEFWSLLDEYKDSRILVIATLNDLSKAPAQIKSRFTNFTIPVPLPNEALRENIIYHHMEHLCSNPDRTLAKFLAKKTEGFSHRTLEDIVQRARLDYLSLDAPSISPSRDNYLQALLEVQQFNNLSKKSFWKRWKPTVKKYGVYVALTAVGAAAGFYTARKGQEAQKKMHDEAMKQQRAQNNSNWWMQLGSMAVSIGVSWWSKKS